MKTTISLCRSLIWRDRPAKESLIVLILLAALHSGCQTGSRNTEPVSDYLKSLGKAESVSLTNFQNVISQLEATLPRDIAIPEHLYRDVPVMEKEFNMMDVFNVLKHIRPVNGYVLDYVYSYHGIGGQPILYGRAEKARKYQTEEELPGRWSLFRSLDSLIYFPDYLPVIQTDGTPQGYAELLALVVKGDHFYLYWHSLMQDDRIVCDSNAVRQVLAEWNAGERSTVEAKLEFLDNLHKRQAAEKGQVYADLWKDKILNRKPFSRDPSFKYLEASLVEKALRLDPTPRVIRHRDRVTVVLTCASDWVGLYQLAWTVKAGFPHSGISVKREPVVYYNCGLQF